MENNKYYVLLVELAGSRDVGSENVLCPSKDLCTSPCCWQRKKNMHERVEYTVLTW